MSVLHWLLSDPWPKLAWAWAFLGFFYGGFYAFNKLWVDRQWDKHFAWYKEQLRERHER